jgi:uncharacterized membrane protein YedE/YeeE
VRDFFTDASTGSALVSLLGGAIIGVAASLLLLFNGRVAGISGIVDGLLRPRRGEWGWRAAFVLGLLAGGTLFAVLRPQALVPAAGSAPLLLAAGVLVGVGTRVGGGCTSGHGVCGLSRLSRRSVAGTATFMIAGMAAVAAVHLLRGAR